MFKKNLAPILVLFLTLIYVSVFPYQLILKFKVGSLNVFLAFGACLAFLYYIFNQAINRKTLLALKIEDVKEEINLANGSQASLIKASQGLKKSINRYNTFGEFVGELNKIIDLEALAAFVIKKTFELFGETNICLLYLLNPKKQQLELFSSFKKDPLLIIKTKQGDLVDKWVFRQHSPILIEDIKKDFRFDQQKLTMNEPLVNFCSLISAPLISEGKLIGSIRLDSLKPNAYDSEDLRFLSVLAGVSALAVSNAELYKRTEELAITDSLTGLYTRNHLQQRLKEELDRVARQKHSLALFMLDIDDFKNYNDKFGHTAGDIVLKRISRALINLAPKSENIVCRYGGEEFVVVVPLLEVKKASAFAEEMRKKIEGESIVLRRQKTNVTVSIGVANFPENGIEPQELINKADQALLKAKRKGKNRVCLA